MIVQIKQIFFNAERYYQNGNVIFDRLDFKRDVLLPDLNQKAKDKVITHLNQEELIYLRNCQEYLDINSYNLLTYELVHGWITFP